MEKEKLPTVLGDDIKTTLALAELASIILLSMLFLHLPFSWRIVPRWYQINISNPFELNTELSWILSVVNYFW